MRISDWSSDVALPIYFRLGLPKTVGLALAVEADRDALRHLGERLAVLVGADHALRELDAAAAGGEVGEIVGDVLPMGGAGEEKAGEAHRIDDGCRAGLAGEQLVVGIADGDAARDIVGEMAGGQRDEDRKSVG